jgi:hypothetical protein
MRFKTRLRVDKIPHLLRAFLRVHLAPIHSLILSCAVDCDSVYADLHRSSIVGWTGSIASGITQVLERLDKLCVLYLSSPDQDAVRLVVQPSVEGSVAAYAQLTRVCPS